jgi:hypothetical protein
MKVGESEIVEKNRSRRGVERSRERRHVEFSIVGYKVVILATLTFGS